MNFAAFSGSPCAVSSVGVTVIMSLLEEISLSMDIADDSDSDTDESGNEYYPEDWREEETLEFINPVVYQVPE